MYNISMWAFIGKPQQPGGHSVNSQNMLKKQGYLTINRTSIVLLAQFGLKRIY